MKTTAKFENFYWFLVGALISTFIHAYIIGEFFTAKKYLKQKVFYMDGALYKLERVR